MTTRTSWAVVDRAADVGALLGAARLAGDGAIALAIGERRLADEVAARSGCETRWMGPPGDVLGPAEHASHIAELVRGTRSVVVLPSSSRHRLLTGLLAGHLGTTAMTDVTSLSCRQDVLEVTHAHYGGGAVRSEEVLSPLVVVSIVTAAFSGDDLAPAPTAAGIVVEAAAPPAASALRLVTRRSEPSSCGRLTAARAVVGAGRGLAKADNLALLERLAGALRAELACTRPVAEELHWLPRDRYLGVSGLQLAPELYVAVGISGQPQHMVGVERTKVVVAINNDRSAPVFAKSDFGVVGDLTEVLPALVAALEER